MSSDPELIHLRHSRLTLVQNLLLAVRAISLCSYVARSMRRTARPAPRAFTARSCLSFGDHGDRRATTESRDDTKTQRRKLPAADLLPAATHRGTLRDDFFRLDTNMAMGNHSKESWDDVRAAISHVPLVHPLWRPAESLSRGIWGGAHPKFNLTIPAGPPCRV